MSFDKKCFKCEYEIKLINNTLIFDKKELEVYLCYFYQTNIIDLNINYLCYDRVSIVLDNNKINIEKHFVLRNKYVFNLLKKQEIDLNESLDLSDLHLSQFEVPTTKVYYAIVENPTSNEKFSIESLNFYVDMIFKNKDVQKKDYERIGHHLYFVVTVNSDQVDGLSNLYRIRDVCNLVKQNKSIIKNSSDHRLISDTNSLSDVSIDISEADKLEQKFKLEEPTVFEKYKKLYENLNNQKHKNENKYEDVFENEKKIEHGHVHERSKLNSFATNKVATTPATTKKESNVSISNITSNKSQIPVASEFKKISSSKPSVVNHFGYVRSNLIQKQDENNNNKESKIVHQSLKSRLNSSSLSNSPVRSYLRSTSKPNSPLYSPVTSPIQNKKELQNITTPKQRHTLASTNIIRRGTSENNRPNNESNPPRCTNNVNRGSQNSTNLQLKQKQNTPNIMNPPLVKKGSLQNIRKESPQTPTLVRKESLLKKDNGGTPITSPTIVKKSIQNISHLTYGQHSPRPQKTDFNTNEKQNKPTSNKPSLSSLSISKTVITSYEGNEMVKDDKNASPVHKTKMSFFRKLSDSINPRKSNSKKENSVVNKQSIIQKDESLQNFEDLERNFSE